MKVLIISHLYPSKNNPSYGVFVHEQVKELKKQGCDVTVVSPVKYVPFPLKHVSSKWCKIADIPEQETLDGVKVYHPRYPSFPKNLLFHQSGQLMYLSIRKVIRNLHQLYKFDMIHAHVALPDGYAAHKISRELNCPFLVTIHGQDFQKTINYNENCKKNIELTLNESAKVILVGSKLKRLLKEAKFNGQINYDIIPNGVDFDRITVTNTKNNYFVSQGPRLLSVSNLYPEKAIDDNLYALKMLTEKYPDVEYNIVGDGPEREKLEALVDELDLGRNVKFLGAFTQKEVFNIMSQCDVFSMPSINEAFGVVYIEAMSLGKPVIGCIGEGPQDIISDKENGFLIERNNVEQLASTLDLLFNNKKLQEEIGRRGKVTVEERFKWEIVAKDIIKEYKKIL